ncbi:amino acid adenylation domain-containing protein, partial [Longimicrobium sp.]|uniref:amino acid adenylation domain-containing protein n=1 Tax=Longimicrobium sp. TaxID=2029185 RepID=UPI002F95FEBA
MTQLSELSPAKRALREARLRGRYQEAPIVPRAQAGDAPLSHAQERLWFIDRMYPGMTAYNLVTALRLPGAFDAAVLERALGEVVRRHDVLRTTFREVNGVPAQVVAPFTGYALPVEDLSALPPAEREAQAQARLAGERARPFDLSDGPVFRASLLRLDAQDHVLLVGMHHIISDAWSLGVFLRELAVLYDAYRQGWDSPLPPLPVQYADYAAWQRSQPPAAAERQLAYWRRQLGGAPELLELPADRPRTPVPSFRGSQVPLEAPIAVLDRLRALANVQGATLHMVLLGTFQVLLARYAGTDDVSVGIAVSGRSRREVEGLIGIFVNTLVLRTDLSGDPTFRTVVDRVREMALDAYQNQEVPFERVVAELSPQRSLSHSALFQVLFLLDEVAPAPAGVGTPPPEPSAASAPAPAEGANGPAPFTSGQTESTQVDLTLVLRSDARGLTGSLEYATDLFDEATARRMAGHLERVLALLAADPDTRLSALPLLDDTERRSVLQTWSGAEAAPPGEGLLHALIAAQAERTPDAEAVVFEDTSLTYGALEARATRLAAHLARLGAGPEVRVGVCLERGPEMMVAILAVLKTGAAYLPLDPGYPGGRLAYMLADAGAPLVVTQPSLRELLAGEGVRIVLVDDAAEGIEGDAGEASRSSVVPANAAYVIYTSGSTGRPKGVVVTHANVVALIAAMDAHVGGTAPGTWLAVSRIGFDASITELFWTLARGFRVVLHPDFERARAEPGALARRIRRHGVTHLQCTPSLLRMLLAESGVEGLAGVERLLLGAEPLPPDLVGELGSVVSAGIVNLYGPTEATVWATAHEVQGVSGRIPVGAPIAGTRVYVLDGALGPQPVGVPGELCIAGTGVARGYLNQPGMTAERFVPDPFASVPGARMYRTGDRGRWVDGTGTAVLDFLGRMDAQVKIRGFRIEPGEIEAVLRQHERVADCVVMVRAETGETRLVAYVVGEADAEALREHLRRSLPEYMVPSAFVALDALPLNPNGKLDRKALPAPELASSEETYVAPRTPTEEVLAGIWAEVLRLERVGLEDRFFDLGGHSLLATRVAARVHQVFGVELPLRALFERPVLSGLAAEVDRLRGSGAAAGPDAIARAPRDGDLPVTFAQERLWFVDALDPGSPVYAIPFSYRITGALDDDALRRALGELVRRHEPLRTTLPAVDGVPVQRISPPPAEFDLPVTDLRHLSVDERRAEAGRLTAEASRHRFDVARGPLFRASLVHVADDEHFLLLNIHHAVGDGWSLGVLREEISALYGAFARGEPSPLPEPVLQYADYAVWQRERLSGAALERQVEFWRQALDGAPALLELPTDRPRPPVESHRGEVERLLIEPALAAEVHALARREGATLFMVLLAALDVVLGRLAGQEDVVVGTPIAGRTRAETERMVGLFLNSLALRADLSGDPTFRELLGRVRESTLEAYAHQDVPFERVLEEVRPERSMAHAPVFQVMLNLMNFQDGAVRGEGLEVAGAGSIGDAASKFDLTLYVGEGDGRIFVTLVYAADLFDAPRMREFLAQLEGVLRQAAAAPETRVGALPLATEAARGVLPDPAAPLDDTWRGAVHELFAARAMETPHALVVEDPRERWTYAELDA